MRPTMYVSIPHRYGKNERKGWAEVFEKDVSIPHRYGKNTLPSPSERALVTSFPFLIGTVRTTRFTTDETATLKVSIPHRYGKNLKNTRRNLKQCYVSIPHRYGKN